VSVSHDGLIAGHATETYSLCNLVGAYKVIFELGFGAARRIGPDTNGLVGWVAVHVLNKGSGGGLTIGQVDFGV
jgi:hypothetical protein